MTSPVPNVTNDDAVMAEQAANLVRASDAIDQQIGWLLQRAQTLPVSLQGKTLGAAQATLTAVASNGRMHARALSDLGQHINRSGQLQAEIDRQHSTGVQEVTTGLSSMSDLLA